MKNIFGRSSQNANEGTLTHCRSISRTFFIELLRGEVEPDLGYLVEGSLLIGRRSLRQIKADVRKLLKIGHGLRRFALS